MKRIHLFEFEDLSWFPDEFRKGITDYLQFQSNLTNIYKPILPIIKKGISKGKSNKIIDLCAGGGGGEIAISTQLKKENVQTTIVLTDLYPNIRAFIQNAAQSDGYIEYIESSVDATNVPENLKGFRTLFVAFHHFKPRDAQRILEDAVKRNEPIGVFEFTERTLLNFMMMFFTPVTVWMFTPFMKSLDLRKILFTYVIPAIPFCAMWDGLVSVLRTYSVREMKEMTAKIDSHDYTWEIGKVSVKGPVNILYLLGYPNTEKGSQ